MTKKKKRVHSPDFKFKVAQEAIKTGKSVETARSYGITHGLLSKWKSQIQDNGHTLFETAPDKENKELRKKMARLEQIIGKKEVELNLVKNFMDFYESHGGI